MAHKLEIRSLLLYWYIHKDLTIFQLECCGTLLKAQNEIHHLKIAHLTLLKENFDIF